MSRQRRQLQKRRAGVEQRIDAIANEHLLLLGLAAPSGSPRARLLGLKAQVLEEDLHGARALAQLRGVGIDPSGENVHQTTEPDPGRKTEVGNEIDIVSGLPLTVSGGGRHPLPRLLPNELDERPRGGPGEKYLPDPERLEAGDVLLGNDPAREGDYRFLCTGDPTAFRDVAGRFLQLPLTAVERVDADTLRVAA